MRWNVGENKLAIYIRWTKFVILIVFTLRLCKTQFRQRTSQRMHTINQIPFSQTLKLYWKKIDVETKVYGTGNQEIWRILRWRYYVCSIAWYHSEIWTLIKLELNYLESFEVSCYKRREKIKYSENEEIIELIGEEGLSWIISYVEKSIGLFKLWEGIAFFMMSFKDRWRKWKE